MIHSSFGSMAWSSVLHESGIVFWKSFFHFRKEAVLQNLNVLFNQHCPFTTYSGPVLFQEIVLQTMILSQYLTVSFSQGPVLQVYALQIDVSHPLFTLLHQRSVPF
jgi:hypothetical protein